MHDDVINDILLLCANHCIIIILKDKQIIMILTCRKTYKHRLLRFFRRQDLITITRHRRCSVAGPSISGAVCLP